MGGKTEGTAMPTKSHPDPNHAHDTNTTPQGQDLGGLAGVAGSAKALTCKMRLDDIDEDVVHHDACGQGVKDAADNQADICIGGICNLFSI
jgi:hypothetical protein